MCDDGGLSLIEVIVAMSIFALVAMGLLTAVSKSLALTRDNRSRVVAANLAAQEMDVVRSTAYDQIGPAIRTQTVGSLTYTIRRWVTPQLASGTGGACAGGTGTLEKYKKVAVQVSFVAMGKAQAVRSDTIVRSPSLNPGGTYGAIGASVIDRNGQPVEGATVVVTTSTGLTDESGCAYVSNLSAGNYTVTASKLGYVGTSGAGSLSQTVGVVTGVVSAPQFQLDSATSLSVRVAALAASGSEVTGYGFPQGGVTPILDNPDRTLTGRVTLTGAPTGSASTWTQAGFPFSSGYEAHLGQCGTGTMVATPPGGAASVTLGLAPLDIQLGPAGMLPVTIANRTIRITHTGTPNCTETYQSATPTAADGSLKLAVPYGSWQLSVVGDTAPGVAVTLAAGTGPTPVAMGVNL